MRTLNNKIASAFFALTACMAMAFGFLACSNDSEPPVVIVVPDNQTKNGETKTDGETNAPVANPAIYTITFNANDGSENPATAAQTFTAGMPQNLKTIASLGFARDGFYFAGWLTAADGAEACWSDGAAYTAVTDATLYAKWSAIPVYKVNVPVNERGEIVATPATARAGTEITLLVTPFAGYKFESLSVTGADSKAIAVTDGKFTMPAQDVTVEADFSAISYTISCGTFAEGLVSADIDTATIGTEVTLLAKPNDGYKFASYSVVAADGSDVSVVDGKFKMPAGNVNVYAVFTAETYMITFDANGGSANSAAASQTFKARNSQALKKVEELGFSRDGYTFAGWLTEIGAEDASYADGASYTATADATLYAKWSAIPIYNVNVPVNERGDVSASPATARAGTKIALTASPKAGYQFAYYTVTDADNKVVSVLNGEFTMPDKNVTVAATFNAIDYRVSVGSFEHGTVKASPSIATVGTEITLTATPKTGYKLGSYTVTDADSNSVLVTDGKFKMPAKDVSVSAAFNAIDYSVTVGSVSNGTVTISAKKATYGTEITLGATPKEGYKFVSYSVTGADGSQVQVEDGKFAMPAQNVMVSATFAAINYTISIGQFEHGTVTASPATATVGTKITLSNTPHEGYKFRSYTVTAADGTAVTVADGKFTMPASNVMVAATFVAKNSGMLKVPLTLEAVEAGAKVTFKNMAAGPVTYKVNGGAAQTIASEATGTITLENEGDKVAFYGDNETYTIKYNRSYNSSKIACDKDCYVYGNIMSLVKSGSFAAADTLSESYIFQKLFSNNTHIKNKDGAELLLPATTLVEYCYDGMFEGCVSLTRAPELPATTLADKCYESMFSGCTNLNSVTCLATDISAENCVKDWLYGVASSGTFTKADGIAVGEIGGWQTNNSSGIPSGWTVKDEGWQYPHSITIADNIAHGSVTAITASAFVGTSVTLTIRPDDGYKLDTLTVKKDASGATIATSVTGDSRTFTMPAKSVTVSATFVAINYTVNIGSYAHGTVTANNASANYGDTVTLTIRPADGYALKTLAYTPQGGASISIGGSGNTRTFTMPAKNVTVSATFNAINYSVNFGTIVNGRVTASPATATVGTIITLSSTPNAGYNFVSYTVRGADGTTVSVADGKFTMPASNVTVTATFLVTFGLWPQTVKASTVDINESESKTVGEFTYYKGSDGQWYARLSDKYYKVEPIKWRVLTTSYNEKLLLAESVLVAKCYAESSNNYQNSEIRKWLNSNAKSAANSDHGGSGGFLKTAFTDAERAKIADTSVDNDDRSTLPDNYYSLDTHVRDYFWNNGYNKYASDTNTTDKVFLLSEQEVTTRAYGFDVYSAYKGDGTHTGSARIRQTTDYVNASGLPCCWWLRSPYYSGGGFVRLVDDYGKTLVYCDVDQRLGVVPALWLKN